MQQSGGGPVYIIPAACARIRIRRRRKRGGEAVKGTPGGSVVSSPLSGSPRRAPPRAFLTLIGGTQPADEATRHGGPTDRPGCPMEATGRPCKCPDRAALGIAGEEREEGANPSSSSSSSLIGDAHKKRAKLCRPKTKWHSRPPWLRRPSRKGRSERETRHATQHTGVRR